jgi:type VII secretion-associated protein (TIGR03931 family)
VTAHLVEVGPNAIRQLCCGGMMVDHDETVRTAFESIDDPVALVDLRPVPVDSLWRMVLGSVNCGSPARAIVVHPSWWAPTWIDVVSAAAGALAGDVEMRPRSWLLTQAFPHLAVDVEIADRFVVIIGAAVIAETRRGELQCVVEAVVRSVLQMTADTTAVVVIDAPSTVSGAGPLGTMIAEGLRASGGVSAVRVDDALFKRYAAEIIQREVGPTGSYRAEGAGCGYRRQWVLALVVLLIIGVLGVLASARLGPPAGNDVPTTFLVEGRVALEVPAEWLTQRVIAGPGSARVQVTSPSDPEMALHVTQSRVALAALSATAESLKHAIDAEPTGVFVDFNPTGNSAGRAAVTYREVRSDHDIRWSVLVDKAVRISIGCQSRRGHNDAMRQVCDLAVRSARALS